MKESSAEMVKRVRRLASSGPIGSFDREAIQYVLDALDNSRNEALEEAAIAVAKAHYGDQYSDYLGKHSGLKIVDAVRKLKYEEKKA